MSNHKQSDSKLNLEPVTAKSWEKLAKEMNKGFDAYYKHNSAANMLRAMRKRAAASGNPPQEGVILSVPPNSAAQDA